MIVKIEANNQARQAMVVEDPIITITTPEGRTLTIQTYVWHVGGCPDERRIEVLDETGFALFDTTL